MKALAAIGVLAAAVIAVNANVLVARWYRRWDLTHDKLYTLSPATTEILRKLEQPVTVLVFLGRGDPLSVSVRHLLTAYSGKTDKLQSRFVDPDQDPAEFLALQQKYQLLAGKTEDGRIVTDASIIVTQGERHWFIASEDIVGVEQDGRAQPRLEQALTEGIVSVLGHDKAKACFSTGHREISRDDAGPEGAAELGHRLEKNNFEIETVDLTAQNANLSSCRALIIAGPQVEFSQAAAERVAAFVKASGNLLVLAAPVLDESQRLRPIGLERALQEFGIELAQDLVLEADESLRLPRGTGEVFFATPEPHAITKGLVAEGGKVQTRVLVSESRSLKPSGSSRALPLLKSSEAAVALHDLRTLTDPKSATESIDSLPRGARVLSMASELQPTKPAEKTRGARIVVFGAPNLIWGRNWRDPALYGNRLIIESAVSWLTSRPPIVSIPEKESQPIGLSLSEEALGEVLRYVLIYMPGSAALLGVFVMLRRRSAERKSRSEQQV